MTLSDTNLIRGPYRAPKTWRAGRPVIEAGGETVRIEGLTEAPIPWPYISGPAGTRSLILCGDLGVAVGRESVAAICHHWGVSRATVTRWRRQLGVGRWTDGSTELARRLWSDRLGAEASRKGGEATKGIPKARRAD
jgi:hypothetical protein